jgi:methionyl-tRNA synthetase
MYVWCDALSNYITAIGYGTETFDAELWDNTLHIVGKDILRFHAAIWPGMLLSAGLSLPKRILVHGHITSGGQKMSKSLGNVIDPKSIIELFREVAGDLAGEVTRFVLLYRIPTFEDGDLTIEAIKEMYVAHLQNGLGNLTNRVMKMATTHGVTLGERISIDLPLLTELDVHKALNELVLRIGELDKRINDEAAFKVVKVDEVKGKELIAAYVVELEALASALSVFMPQTSAKILECIAEHKMPEKPLFNRFT